MGQIIGVEIAKIDARKAETELALKEFGLELQRIRLSKRLTQKRLHEISGVDKTVISELENGTYTPSLVMVRQLANGLGVSPYVLIAPYYGIPLPNFELKDKEALEKFINLAKDYLKSQPLIEEGAVSDAFSKTPQLTPGQQKAKHKRRSTDFKGGTAASDSTPDIEPPINPGQEPLNQNPIDNSQ